MHITHELRARQQTTLTPRLQQSVKLLQMSTLDFSREVAQAIASNPFLEDPDESTDGGGAGENGAHAADMKAGERAETEGSLAGGDTIALPTIAQDLEGGASAEHYGDDVLTVYEEAGAADESRSYSGDYPAARDPDHSGADVGQWARSEVRLRDVLRENLCERSLTERDRSLVEVIIEALDDDGYLRVSFDDLASKDQFSPPVSDCEWEISLRLVQQAARPGIAARSLGECLALQLSAMDDADPARATALRIVTQHLEKLGKCDYAGLARVLGTSETTVREACVLIRKLDPRPAGRYSVVDPSCYVVPDVIVRKIGKRWVALSNHDSAPRARLHSAYAQMFKESRYNERSLMAGALQEARWLIRSLEQRSTTIQRVAEAIVARQQTFFDYGEIALRPMMLSEIADELGMHESTVSRATSNKYLASPRGVYEFKHFFSRELATQSGGTCSAVAVRALIQDMIDEENPKEPLSDVVLAQKLAREGVVVARRTVSKYRAQIKYPSAELRRAP
jgi:RNA polymerase sigma-54 factor